MDSHGVPRKINRHVFKAINFYTYARNGSKFREIYNFVRLYNKNLAPVLHLKEAVFKSLNNLQRFGLIRKSPGQKFKMRSGIGLGRARKDRKLKRTSLKRARQQVPKTKITRETQKDLCNSIKPDTAPSLRKRITNNEPSSSSKSSVIKRLRGDKRSSIEDRKGKDVELPRARHQKSKNDALIPLYRAEAGVDGSKINLAAAAERDFPRQESDLMEVTQSEEALPRIISQLSSGSNDPNNNSNIRVKTETTEDQSNQTPDENVSDGEQNSG